MWDAALTVGVFVVIIFVTCMCCRICARQHAIQREQRARAATRMRTRHEHVLVAVIPASLDGQSTPPHLDMSYWGPPPPPYSAAAPATAASTTTDGANVTAPPHSLPSIIASRLQTASPPPIYESPPPYN